jgi:folate-binding Fe-S cluster repair protein YgfZ
MEEGLEVVARIIAQGQTRLRNALLKLEAQTLLRNPSFDAIVSANGVDPSAWLEIAVEDT